MNKLSVQGFTLIELVMVMVIMGVLGAMTTDIMIFPVTSYINLEKRTTLVDTAEMTLRRMQRDIRSALPNSIRITGAGTTIEFLHISAGGRYRAKLNSDGAGNPLDFTTLDTSFEVMGTLDVVPSGEVVVYNLGSALANAYVGHNRVRIKNTSTVNVIDLNTATQFPFSSPQQRFYIIDTPISYRCVNGELRRYDGYTITSTTPNLASLSYDLQAKANAMTCSFTYDAGTAMRAGLVILDITLSDGAGESFTLIHQVHVNNIP